MRPLPAPAEALAHDRLSVATAEPISDHVARQGTENARGEDREKRESAAGREDAAQHDRELARQDEAENEGRLQRRDQKDSRQRRRRRDGQEQLEDPCQWVAPPSASAAPASDSKKSRPSWSEPLRIVTASASASDSTG